MNWWWFLLYSLNNDVHLDEEHILGHELEVYNVNGEPYDTFTQGDVSVGPISEMQFKDEKFFICVVQRAWTIERIFYCKKKFQRDRQWHC